ncbi:MAG TPA: LPXTG cell wall anchor domain-containing protein [Frankiaceae bacterium]|jgi:LPXTG-motif cell wall-anchored protein|nr:LPXTG cell wall anchor domain-containing protein [Frankiaceae bacterium]
MSTITRESVRNALPQTGRGDAIFAAVAMAICLLALILKVSGIA